MNKINHNRNIIKKEHMYRNLMSQLEQQHVLLDIDDEKEQLQVEILELKNLIEEQMLYLRHNRSALRLKPIDSVIYEEYMRIQEEFMQNVDMLEFKMRELYN